MWSFRQKEGLPFDCSQCSDKDKEERNCFNRLNLPDELQAVENYTEEIKVEILQQNLKKVFSLGGLRFYTCPASYISEETGELMRLIFLIDASGHLLYSGGWADQPYWLIEVYEIYKVEHLKYLESVKQK